MTDAEKLESLRKILSPVLSWYEKVLEEGEPDSSYLYDTSHDVFNDNLSRSDFQNIIEILR